MSERSFIDSNVLAYTDDDDAPAKKEKALEIYSSHRRDGRGVVSTQVLQEYFVTATRKLRVDPLIAKQKTQLFARLQVVSVRVDDVLAAIDLHRLHQISFWDALIIRAALVSACARLYSEDLQDGWRIDGLTVIDPFA